MTRLAPARLAPALLACLALGACSSRSETAARRPSLDEIATGSVATASSPPLLAGERIAAAPARREGELTVALPSWVGPRGATEVRRFEDGYTTATAMGRAPRNADSRDGMTLGVRLTGEAAIEGGVGIVKPTEAGIRTELAEQFPDVDMKVTGRSARNTYGPYGFAVGRRADGARCLYAWQWVEDVQPRLGKTEARIPGSVRVRLCRADMTFDALAASIDQLKLVPDGRAAAVASRAPDVRRGSRRVARTTAVSSAPAVSVAPAPVAVAVEGRRYLARPGPAVAIGSPVAGYAVPSATPLVTPLPSVSGSAAPLPRSPTSDLPAEAFRGPRLGPARTGPPPG